eukprot:scaffold1367_cov27-Tisochrysis_lutea.AAC.2
MLREVVHEGRADHGAVVAAAVLGCMRLGGRAWAADRVLMGHQKGSRGVRHGGGGVGAQGGSLQRIVLCDVLTQELRTYALSQIFVTSQPRN